MRNRSHPSASTNLQNIINDCDDNESSMKADKLNTFIGNLMSGTVSYMVAEVKGLVINELGRVFPNINTTSDEMGKTFSIADYAKDVQIKRFVEIEFSPSS